MLIPNESIYCGVYDSDIIRKNHSVSRDRAVECYEIELFHRAGGVSYVDGRAYPCKRGMLLCAKPGQIRHSEFPVRCSFIRYFPDGGDVQTEAILAGLQDVMLVEDEATAEELFALFARLGAYFAAKEIGAADAVRINAVFLEILYRIMRIGSVCAGRNGDTPMSRVAREAREYINENYTQDCSLSKIAEAVRVSPNYLHTAFSRGFGVTPYEYALRKRLEKAKRLIMAGEKSMLEIALELGFCSQSHFNKLFKEREGVTPAQYRAGILSRY